MAGHGGHGRVDGAGEPRLLGGGGVGGVGGELLEVVPHEGADHKVLVCGLGRKEGKYQNKR